MERLSLRQGTWWFQQPDETWMRWKPGDKWKQAPRPDPPDFPCKDVATERLLSVEECSIVSVEDYSSADLELLKSVVEQLRFVTTMFWQQANFFTAIQSALLGVAASQFFYKGISKLWPLVYLSAVGLVLALVWFFVAWRRVQIIDKWTCQVRHIDQEVDRHRLYKRALENTWYKKPTHITMRFLPWLLVLAWGVLLAWSLLTDNGQPAHG